MVTCDLFIKTAGDDVARKGKRNEKVKKEVGEEGRVEGQQTKKNTHFLCENTKISREKESALKDDEGNFLR